MPRLAAVLFDMDGLLVDTEPQWFEVEIDVMTKLGGTWTAVDHAASLGGSALGCAKYMVKKANAAVDHLDVARWLVDGIVDRAHAGVTILPGARELLADLAASRVLCGLVSSSARVLVDAVMAHVGSDLFAVTVAGDEVARTKPHPEPYLVAAARLSADPAACVVLEDSPNGVAGGLAAGCFVLAVPQGPISLPAHPRLTVARSLADLSAAALAAVVNSTQTAPQ